MPEDRQQLTSKSLEEFVSKVHRDPKLKERIIKKLENPSNVISVINEFFIPDDKQKENLSIFVANVKEMEEELASVVRKALTTGGRIRLIPPDELLIKPQNAGVHIGVHNGPNGTDIDVSITCPV